MAKTWWHEAAEEVPGGRRRQAAFTLIELMVVVAIIGVLASIAVPAYLQNARKAKSSEAVINIRKIYIQSRAYLMEANQARAQIVATPVQFPEPIGDTPAASCCTFPGQKCPPNPSDWIANTWTALAFSVDDPHYYRYAYGSTGSQAPGPGSNFTAAAHGDLNCDGTYSTFEMVGVWSSTDNDVHGSAGIYEDKVTE
jgi:type IV pilus assembly protein PilA